MPSPPGRSTTSDPRSRRRVAIATAVGLLALLVVAVGLVVATREGDPKGEGAGKDRSGCPLMQDIPQPAPPLSAADTEALDREVARTRKVLEAMPTVGAAVKAGYVLSQPSPAGVCLPSHLIKWDQMDGRWDVDHPEMLLAEGNEPTSRVVAASYFVISPHEPEGFTGRDDTFHYHPGFCLHPKTMVADESSIAVCRSEAGRPFGGGWMVHVWPLPGAVNPAGMFAVTYPGFRNEG